MEKNEEIEGKKEIEENENIEIEEMKEMTKEFHNKYLRKRSFTLDTYDEKCVGFDDIKNYPDTKTHRKMFPNLYNFIFYYHSSYIVRNFMLCWCN